MGKMYHDQRLWKPINEISHGSHLSSQLLSLLGPDKTA